MRKKLLSLLISGTIPFTLSAQDTAYIKNQALSAQNANAWISGKFTSGFMQTFQGTSTGGTRHYDFFGGSATPAGANLRWSFVLQGQETGSNAGTDFKIWSYADNGTFLNNPFSISRASGVVSIGTALAATIINTNNPNVALSISGGTRDANGYRGAEIGLRGGSYSTTPGEMSFHTGLGGGGTAQPERMRIDANGLVTMGYGLRLNNATSNNISFDPVGLGGPTFTTRSVGTRITLHPALGSASGDYAIGIEPQHMWFGINVRNVANGFKFYAGTNQIGRIDGFGATDWEGQGRFKGWYNANGTGPAAEIGVSNGTAVLIGYDRTPGATRYIPLALSGGTTSSNQTNITINEIGVGVGTNTFFGKFNIYDPVNNKASITMQSNGDSRFWINEGDNALKLGGVGGSTPPAQGVLNITNQGLVGIGTLAPQSELSVKGTITAQRVKVTQTGWADYVFHKDYPLSPLAAVEKYVTTYQHLEGIPSAVEVAKEGIDVGEMNKKLLEKVEELTLYLIEQNKKIVALEEWKKQQESRQH
ncbi:hypothetical protein [Chitinophaga sp. Ak27]|uniref:hypothetical protein n=1 Tax=Chitinophaga sp. Ak27 TaxID=2726116 RepID=UPI00145E3400|nr:hypothetical protein [Chitinophaga sp. Ak27]NLU94423.1 hypothetical protein [Chitinophaga sp. Ak27]